MNNKLVDLRPEFFVRAYNNEMGYVESLHPGMLQDYCSILLDTASLLKNKKKISDADYVLKKIHKLILSFPDNPTNIKNLSLYFNAVFNVESPVFVASEPTISLFDANSIYDLIYFYSQSVKPNNMYQAFCKFRNKKTLLSIYFNGKLKVLNTITNVYLSNEHLCSHYKKTQHGYHLGHIMCNYKTILSFNKYLISGTNEMLHSIHNGKLAGIAFLQSLFHATFHYNLKVILFNNVITIPKPTEFLLFLSTFDAVVHHWNGENFYHLSMPTIHFIQDINLLNYRL